MHDGNKRKYLVYKITNRFNGKIYIGCHSTLNKNDRYMGSGVEIKEALKKEGRKSFVKEILFEFDNKEEMLLKEKELVTKEFCMREDTYNRIEGGGTYSTLDMISVKNPEGGYMMVYRDDPRWLSGELVGVTKGMITVKDSNGSYYQVDKNDERYLSGELVHILTGIRLVKDKGGNKFHVFCNDERILSGELVAWNKGLAGTKGFKSKKCSDEHKRKIGLANSEKQKGEGNSQYGTCWITKEKVNKKIKKENIDKYLKEGWIQGRFLN